MVKPVVAHPAIDHGIHRHRHFQGRMRIHQRHQGQEAIVGNADNAHFTVRFRHIPGQPLDGVPGVGGMIDRGRIERAGQRAVHHVIAFRPILAAHVLHHADVAAFDDDVGGVVVALQDGTEVGTVGMADQAVGVVGRTGQQHRRILGVAGDDDDGIEPGAVAHGHHHGALDVVITAGDGEEFGGRLGRIVRVLGLRLGRGGGGGILRRRGLGVGEAGQQQGGGQ